MLSGRRAGGRPAKEAGQPRRRQEGTKAGGGGGSWRPTNWLPAKPGELLGNSSARLKCQGQRNRRTAGAEMWVTAAPGPRGAGWRHWPGRPHDATGPRPPQGKKRLLVRQGPLVPSTEPGPAPGHPDGWAGGQRAPPQLPSQTPESPEQPLLSSRRKLRVGRLPRPGSRLRQLAKLELAFVFRQTGFPSPPSLCPRDISFPQIPSSGFPQAEMGPRETRNQTWESPRSLGPLPSNLYLYPLPTITENLKLLPCFPENKS